MYSEVLYFDIKLFLILVPSAPTDLVVTSVRPTMVSITWGDPHTPNGNISMYTISCGTPVTPLTYQYKCQGLVPGMDHNISVRAFTGAGGGVAASVTVTTPCEC